MSANIIIIIDVANIITTMIIMITMRENIARHNVRRNIRRPLSSGKHRTNGFDQYDDDYDDYDVGNTGFGHDDCLHDN